MDRFPVAAASQSALALPTGGLPIDAALTKDWKRPTCLMSGRLQLSMGAVKKKKKEKTFSAPIIVSDQTTDQAATVWDPKTSLQTEIQITETNDLKVCTIWLNLRFLY